MDNMQLALTLDLKPFLAQLQTIPGTSQQTIATLNQLFATVKPPKVAPTTPEIDTASKDLDRLKNSFYQLIIGETDAASKALQFAQSQNLSSSQIDLLVNSMQKELGTLGIMSAEYQEVQNSINHLVNAKQRMIQASAGGGRALQQMSGSTMSLNYILRDSPFLFQRLDMGIMAISNNLNPFIDDMIRAKAATGSWKAAIGSMTSGLIGIGGLSVAFSLVVAAIQAWSFVAAKAERDTKKFKDTVKELRDELDKASYETLKRKEIETRIKLLDAENKLTKEQNEEWAKKELSKKESTRVDKKTLGSEETRAEMKTQQETLDVIIEKQKELGLVKEAKNKIDELEAYKLTLRSEKEIEAENKQIKVLSEKYKLDKESKAENLITYDFEIREKIKLIDLALLENRSEREKHLLLRERIALVEDLTAKYVVYLRAYEKGPDSKDKTAKQARRDFGFGNAGFTGLPDIKVDKAMNAEMEKTVMLANMLTDSFNRAGDAVAGAMGQSVYAFKQANSLLQIFINELIRAQIEALVLKGIEAAGNLFSGGLLGLIGGIFGGGGGSAATSVPGIPSSGLNKSATNPGGTGLTNISMPTSAASYRYSGSSSTPIIQQVPVILDSRIKGRDIVLTQRKDSTYRRKHYGAAN